MTEIPRIKPWACYSLDRYNKEGIEELRDKPKNGRTPQIPLEVSARIRKRLTESNKQQTNKPQQPRNQANKQGKQQATSTQTTDT